MKLFKLATTIALLSLAAQAVQACPKGTYEHNKQLDGKVTCVLEGPKDDSGRTLPYTDDLFLPNDYSYVLKGGVFVGYDNGKAGKDLVLDPATLTIEAGTKIFALNPSKDESLPIAERVNRKDFLVISRGSKILAEGTEAAPIVFTSARDMHISDSALRQAPQRQDWGGLIIDGQSLVNRCADKNNCVLDGEAGTGYYGGNDPNDNSGVLRYVRVEFGGDEINDEKEFNGITFNSVGAGTVVEYVQVHMNNDDGIEFFGGTVNAKYVLITGAADDSVDWTYGYTGMIQYLAIQQYEDDGDRGIEADNDKDVDLLPRSQPVISNMTMIGRKDGDVGLKLRVGTGAIITNSVVTGFDKACIENGTANVDATQLFNNVFACGNMPVAKTLPNNLVLKAEELGLDGMMPVASSILLGSGELPDDFDFFFDDVDYIGAFKDVDWTAGWTVR